MYVSKNYLQCLPETVQMRAIKVELTRCQKPTLAPVGLRTQFKHFSEMQRMTKIDSLLQKKKTGLVELNCQPRKLDSFAKSNWQILRIVLHDQHEFSRSYDLGQLLSIQNKKYFQGNGNPQKIFANT